MDALDRIERERGFSLPAPYRAFAERGYLSHERPEYLWVNEAEWIPPAEMLAFEGHGDPKPGLVAFAFGGGGDAWCWQTLRPSPAGEPYIAYCPHDDYCGHWYAPSFIGWLYRVGLGYAAMLWDPEHETRANLAAWVPLIREFGHPDWAADLEEVSRRPVTKVVVGRRNVQVQERLINPDEVRARVAAAFGEELVDSPFVWDIGGDRSAE